MPTAPVRVDVWSDIACPFCYIGKRNLEAAVSTSGVPVEITYRSFQLDPDLPEDITGSNAEQLAAKMGVTVERARGMERQTTTMAQQVGLDFDYERMQPANTFHAHRLLHLARAHGRQAELKDRLLSAFFVEGRHVGHLEELADLAAEAGLDRDVAIAALADGSFAAEVADDVARARAYGITGVPFFVLDEKLAVSGAQPAEVFVEALQRAVAEQEAA
ncbi:DsbA family oxidoreductase [Isoptericola croceus]|uniref:DsbA family oxidoreductase n=1 Tax=Isoptericola croceus TaxID=3031406 RepID=UPI0023F88B26|nr:DsbA family oxidoreductase [Isoptericola croceus]